MRGCRVKRLEVAPGLVQAQVQDREAGAATVEIRFPVLTDDQWTQVIEALSQQALFTAQLLDGSMPAEIESVFTAAGTALLPAVREITQTCSACPPGALAGTALCRPLLAVYQQLGEMLREDPWLLLRLRGRIASRCSPCSTSGATALPVQPRSRRRRLRPWATPRSKGLSIAQPLAQLPRSKSRRRRWSFSWGISGAGARCWKMCTITWRCPLVELALLRRLGPPTPGPDGPAALAQLQIVYRRVTDRVWALAFAPDEEEAAAEGNGQE